MKGDQEGVIKILALWRTWRDAQRAYAQALEGEDHPEITARYSALLKAYREYEKHNPQRST